MILVKINSKFIILLVKRYISDKSIHFIIKPVNGGKPANESKLINIMYLLELFKLQTDWLFLLLIGSNILITINLYNIIYRTLISSFLNIDSSNQPVWFIDEKVISVNIRSSFNELTAPIISLLIIKILVIFWSGSEKIK